MDDNFDKLHQVIDIFYVERNFKDRSNPIEDLDDGEFMKRFRFPKDGVLYIFDMISEDIIHRCDQTTHVPPFLQLLVCLRWYASGSFQIIVGDIMGLHQSSVSRIVKLVSRAIAMQRPTEIIFPDENEIKSIQRGFYEIAQFPGIIGTIDCTHVPIQCPKGDQAELFRNRKGSYSINVQVIADHNLMIRDIVARWPGSTHDTRIFDNSAVSMKLETRNTGYILGDAGYPCRSYLLTPYRNPTTISERRYNFAHAQTRNTVERVFGVLKRRFPCLSTTLRTNLDTTMAVIVATSVLHNIARRLKLDEANWEMEMPDDNQQEQTAHDSRQGNAVRRTVTLNYF